MYVLQLQIQCHSSFQYLAALRVLKPTLTSLQVQTAQCACSLLITFAVTSQQCLHGTHTTFDYMTLHKQNSVCLTPFSPQNMNHTLYIISLHGVHKALY